MGEGRQRRILLAGFKHETNTFSQLPTTLESYKARTLVYGADIPRTFRHTKTEMAAFLDACRENDWQAVHPICGDATPSGKVTEETFDHFASTIVNSLTDDAPIDAIMLSLHGAMVCEHTGDGEGELLARIREKCGSNIPIAITLDLHANVTDRMAALADIIVAYRTYPHIDQYEIAGEAAALMRRTLDGEIRPTCTVRRGDMLDGADHGRTTAPGPMTEALETAARFTGNDGILSVSICAGFPWADMKDTGPSALIVSDGENAQSGTMAESLIDQLWQSRSRQSIQTLPVGAAMAAVKSAPDGDGAIVIADFADNPGGGGYGDSTPLLRAMIEADLQDAAFGMIYDPVAVQTCIDQGLGGHAVVAIGGKIDRRFGDPIAVTGRVLAITDGTLRLQGPMMAGTQVNMGATVVLQVGGIDIVLTSGRFQCYDRMYFEHARIDLTKKSVIAVKSSHHFRAAFGELASQMLVVDSGGGLTSRNYKDLPFENIRRPVYPLDMN
jgi:microcystin degradation protein MlrC